MKNPLFEEVALVEQTMPNGVEFEWNGQTVSQYKSQNDDGEPLMISGTPNLARSVAAFYRAIDNPTKARIDFLGAWRPKDHTSWKDGPQARGEGIHIRTRNGGLWSDADVLEIVRAAYDSGFRLMTRDNNSFILGLDGTDDSMILSSTRNYLHPADALEGHETGKGIIRIYGNRAKDGLISRSRMNVEYERVGTTQSATTADAAATTQNALTDNRLDANDVAAFNSGVSTTTATVANVGALGAMVAGMGTGIGRVWSAYTGLLKNSPNFRRANIGFAAFTALVIGGTFTWRLLVRRREERKKALEALRIREVKRAILVAKGQNPDLARELNMDPLELVNTLETLEKRAYR